MEILNRSAITVVPKQAFMDWANALTPEFPLEINILGQSHTYLTNPDFEDAQKHIKKYFKQIFIDESRIAIMKDRIIFEFGNFWNNRFVDEIRF
jgi:hypothetical protein